MIGSILKRVKIQGEARKVAVLNNHQRCIYLVKYLPYDTELSYYGIELKYGYTTFQYNYNLLKCIYINYVLYNIYNIYIYIV